MIIKKLTRLQFHTFVENYYHYKNESPHTSIGREFLNRFYNDTADPDLFYCEDDTMAINMIENDYVEDREQKAA